MDGGGVYGNVTGGRRGAALGGLTNGLVITFLPAFLLGVLGHFGDADFGWFGMLVGGGSATAGAAAGAPVPPSHHSGVVRRIFLRTSHQIASKPAV
ncbi:hypothetical protein FRC0535_01977 [Corynebacterium diphtheriae]|nr:hypothetical protein FRC0535_01977 [Corynebacterium diphtheriae]